MVERIELSQLRDDIKNYLAENLESVEYYRELSKREGGEAWVEDYERHKKAISKLCGWGAPTGKYNQKVYDLAIEILKERLSGR